METTTPSGGVFLIKIKDFNQGQHRIMGAAGFGRSFTPIVQYEKWEIHPVFPHFPYFRLGQNLSPNLLAPLCGVAQEIVLQLSIVIKIMLPQG